MIFLVLFSISELTFLVKSFTRFSEEIFTGVVAFFFMVEAFRTIVKVYISNTLHCVVILSCITTVITQDIPAQSYMWV